jgi:hypothetical protein
MNVKVKLDVSPIAGGKQVRPVLVEHRADYPAA